MTFTASNKNSVIVGSCVSLAVVLLLASIIYLCYRYTIQAISKHLYYDIKSRGSITYVFNFR